MTEEQVKKILIDNFKKKIDKLINIDIRIVRDTRQVQYLLIVDYEIKNDKERGMITHLPINYQQISEDKMKKAIMEISEILFEKWSKVFNL